MCIRDRAMTDHNTFTISLLPAYLYYCTIARRIHGCSYICGKVHSCMKASCTINRVDACAVSRGYLFQVSVGYRLYAWYMFQTIFLAFGKAEHFIKRVRLYIDLLFDEVHLLCSLYNQIRAFQLHQVIVPSDTSDSRTSDRGGDRVCMEYCPVEIVVSLLYICLLYTSRCV